MSVVFTPSAREIFTPRELVAAYKEFTGHGGQQQDAESGVKAAAFCCSAPHPPLLLASEDPTPPRPLCDFLQVGAAPPKLEAHVKLSDVDLSAGQLREDTPRSRTSGQLGCLYHAANPSM
jgi:hypothetical protein